MTISIILSPIPLLHTPLLVTVYHLYDCCLRSVFRRDWCSLYFAMFRRTKILRRQSLLCQSHRTSSTLTQSAV